MYLPALMSGIVSVLAACSAVPQDKASDTFLRADTTGSAMDAVEEERAQDSSSPGSSEDSSAPSPAPVSTPDTDPDASYDSGSVAESVVPPVPVSGIWLTCSTKRTAPLSAHVRCDLMQDDRLADIRDHTIEWVVRGAGSPPSEDGDTTASRTWILTPNKETSLEAGLRGFRARAILRSAGGRFETNEADSGAEVLLNLVHNGSFEIEASRAYGNYEFTYVKQEELSHWVIEPIGNCRGALYLELHRNSGSVPSGHGTYFIDTDCGAGCEARIYQDLTTVPGAAYDLSFMAYNTVNSTSGGLLVGIDDKVHEISLKKSGVWKEFTLRVHATSELTRVSFEDAGAYDGQGPDIDHVRFVRVDDNP